MKKILIAILTIFLATINQTTHAQNSETTQAQNSDFVQIVDIGAERFVDHLRKISSDVEFSDVQKTSDEFNSPTDPLHAWISFYGAQKIDGTLIFFVNGNGYVSSIGITSTAGDDVLNRIIRDSLVCIGLTDFEIDLLKNSTDSIQNVTCASMRRKVFLDRQPGSILLFATEE